jgi:DNA-binding NarL/FixJ family response regulator
VILRINWLINISLIDTKERDMIRKEVMQGNNKKSLFTKRMKEIIIGIRDGLCNKQIGEKLGVSIKTVENTIRTCLLKAEALNRSHLVVCALRLGEIGLYEGIEP